MCLSSSSACSIRSVGTTNYLHDGATIVDEVDNSGNVLARYAATTDVDELLAELRGSTGSFYQQDALGSVTSLSSSGEASLDTYTYDSFGKLTASTGTLSNPFQYDGREFDTETGAYYYRARYYDHDTGRFISEDPVAFDGDGPNFYTFVENDPTNAIDPWGLRLCRTTLPGLGRAYVDSELYPSLQQWIEYNRNHGFNVTFTEAFRTSEYQAGLQSNSNAITPAKPGTSLHEAGFAVDISWRRLPRAQQAEVVRNAALAGLSWGGNFRKPDQVHFYVDPGHRASRIADAQRQYKNRGAKCNDECGQ